MNCQNDLEEFLTEAEIMKNFDHENVVRLLGEIHNACTCMLSKSSGLQMLGLHAGDWFHLKVLHRLMRQTELSLQPCQRCDR